MYQKFSVMRKEAATGRAGFIPEELRAFSKPRLARKRGQIGTSLFFVVRSKTRCLFRKENIGKPQYFGTDLFRDVSLR